MAKQRKNTVRLMPNYFIGRRFVVVSSMGASTQPHMVGVVEYLRFDSRGVWFGVRMADTPELSNEVRDEDFLRCSFPEDECANPFLL